MSLLPPSAKILIVEDESDLLRTLEYNFRQAGFEVLTTAHGRDAIRLVGDQSPALVLLDLMLPDIAGTEVCKQIKSDPKTRNIHVIMLTAKGEEVDRVVTKPFSVRELVLRVRAVLRRAEPIEPPTALRIRELSIDSNAHRVQVGGKEVPMTALEFRLLLTLATRQGRVQTRETLLNDVWGLHLSVETRTVDKAARKARLRGLAHPNGARRRLPSRDRARRGVSEADWQ